LIERRKTQLDPEARAEFEREDTNWRNGTEEEMAEVKDPKDQTAARAAATFVYLTNLRERQWLPVYEPCKVE
jgi:hypothetical protein